jgi:uncharacterized small protein (DUF1192 family)
VSENTTLNAVLALLEGRPELARSFLRYPGSEIASITDLQTRIYRSMEVLRCQAVKEAMRKLLDATVRKSPSDAVLSGDLSASDAFVLGVTEIEDMITEIIHACERNEAELCR